jgi:glycine oxidase
VHSREVLVVGGGVIGSALAYALAREGAAVRLLEREEIGRQASSTAAGMLAPLEEPEVDDPIRVAGLASIALLAEHIAELRELSGIDPQLEQSGILELALPGAAARLRRQARRLEAFDCRWLDAEEARKLEPRLANDIEGGVWSPREAHVDGLLLSRAFAGAAERRGAKIQTGVEVTGLEFDGARAVGVRTSAGLLGAGEVVLCAGAWTTLVAGQVGGRIPVSPVKGQVVALRSPRRPLPTILRGDGVYLVPRTNGELVVGATVEHAGFDTRTTAGAIESLLAGARRLVPALGECAFVEARAGLRPDSADHLPIVGAVPDVAGLFVASGHYRNGILLAAVTGFGLAQQILHGTRRPDLEPFDPARFAR